jgi:hypothetical protein
MNVVPPPERGYHRFNQDTTGRRDAERSACRHDVGPPPLPPPPRAVRFRWPAKADFPRWDAPTLGLQPRYEDVALEALIEPELLIAASQLRQVLRDIGRQFGHRDHAVTIDIGVIT